MGMNLDLRLGVKRMKTTLKILAVVFAVLTIIVNINNAKCATELLFEAFGDTEV